MKYTIDNLKYVKHYDNPEEDNFTGVVKDKWNHMVYYKDGMYHREDGPAVQYANGRKDWWYNDNWYGVNNDFTVESWINKWKLEIFK